MNALLQRITIDPQICGGKAWGEDLDARDEATRSCAYPMLANVSAAEMSRIR